MDQIADIKAEIAQLRGELGLEGSHDHAHGGHPSHDEERAEHLRARLTEREDELRRREVDAERDPGFRGAKDLDAEAFEDRPS